MKQAHSRVSDQEDRIPSGRDLYDGVDLDKIQGEAREKMLAQPLNPFVRLVIKLLPRNPIAK